ncbi:unnamed protein product [Spirodela intermedia]|uniref:RNA helicase n=1 Tax=Spirodela intermedia TaxID=51605 RepID=A0A7I8L7L2_SPIIN|nr:unnamed protein product [Spirodela intermedia]
MSSVIGVSSLYLTAPAAKPLLKVAATAAPSSCFCSPRSGPRSRELAISAVATTTPTSVLSEEAFKGFEGRPFTESPLEEHLEDVDEEVFDEEDGEVVFGSERDSVDGDELAVSNLGLPQRLVNSLTKRGITRLFPIQRAVLLPALEGRDIIARAKTGTGKTLAFGIPIIKKLTEADEERIMTRQTGRLPRVLVLAPTRELAKQVEKEIKESAPYLSTVCVYGGVSYNLQKNAITRGVDVVVGTPGRIIDLVNSSSLKLSEVQFLVLDEADQMLAVGFEEDVEVILDRLPRERQSMLFSATMPGWVKKLSRKHLDNPLTIDLVGDDEEKLAEGIRLYAVPATASKRVILSDLITVYSKGGKTIVFTQTKRDADEVSTALSSSIASEALHGDISQHQRERTLNGFRQGKFTVLVATDVAARGLDIPNVDLIIHYELPNDPETFVHRSGRTGRAGKEGTAILMFTGSQRRTIKSLERDVGCRFEFISPPSVPELPALEDDGPRGDNYGKFSNREGGGRRGSRGRSSRGSGGWGGSRGSGEEDSFRHGGRSFKSDDSWTWSSSKHGRDDRPVDGRRPNSGLGSSGSRDRYLLALVRYNGTLCGTCLSLLVMFDFHLFLQNSLR